MLPFVISGDQIGVASAYTVINIVAGAINVILAAVAFLLVRNTVWVRKLVGGAIYVVAGVLVLTVPPLLTRLMYEVMLDLGPGLWIQSLIFAMFSVVITSAMLIGWNVARCRRCWVHVVAAGLALIKVTIYWLVQLLFNVTGVDRAVDRLHAGALPRTVVRGTGPIACLRRPARWVDAYHHGADHPAIGVRA